MFSTVLIMLIITLLAILALEFGFRFVRDLAKGSPWIARAENVDDSELGWALNPDKQSTTKTNACGEIVVRGPPASRYLNKVPRFKDGLPVLFVGNSFTQGTEVSNGALYYDVFEKNAGGRYAVSVDLLVDDRYLYVSCWGTGEFRIKYDVTGSVPPEESDFSRLRRHRQ